MNSSDKEDQCSLVVGYFLLLLERMVVPSIVGWCLGNGFFCSFSEQVHEVVSWFAMNFWLGSWWVGNLLNVDSSVFVLSGRDPDLVIFDGIRGRINGPWMSGVSSHGHRSSSGDFAIADQLALIVIPHQFDSVVRIILKDDWDTGATRGMVVLLEVHEAESGDRVGAHVSRMDVGSGIPVADEVGHTIRDEAIKFGVEVDESKLFLEIGHLLNLYVFI